MYRSKGIDFFDATTRDARPHRLPWSERSAVGVADCGKIIEPVFLDEENDFSPYSEED